MSAQSVSPASTTVLSPSDLSAALTLRDLTRPEHGPHALQLVLEELVERLQALWSCDTWTGRWHPVVPVEDNYERLGYAPDAVTRDVRYTRYVSETCMLRSHSSAGIPPMLRRLAAQATRPDTLLVCPGMCYRRDVIGRYHTGTPHQVDLWRIVEAPMDREDLLGMIDAVVSTVLPGRQSRTTETEHPYTVGGLQIDVLSGGQWVEIGECGVAAPGVLAAAGLPPSVSGLAMGLGLDRLLMLHKGIPDIRLLRSADTAVSEQMLDLTPYRAVSSMPAVTRDLSVAWPKGSVPDEEEVGAKVREALGPDADAVEQVAVLAVAPYDDVPHTARSRLGMLPGQVNVLLRVVLRDLSRTLTDQQANAMRDRVYAAVHAGTRHQWSGAPGAAPESAR